jgi:hypothetical protein
LAQLPDARVLALLLGNELAQLRHDVTPLVHLTLPRDLAWPTARIFDAERPAAALPMP